jgi:hypothetical protein
LLRALRQSWPLLAVLLIAGCPFASEHPLSDPSTALVDRALVGAWKAQDPDTGEWRVLTFLVFNDHELVGVTPADEKDRVDAYRVFVTPVGNERFLNVRELPGDTGGWYLVRYRIDADRLVLGLVDDGLFGDRAFAGSGELRDFVQRNLDDPRLYAASGEEREEMIWTRVTP